MSVCLTLEGVVNLKIISTMCTLVQDGEGDLAGLYTKGWSTVDIGHWKKLAISYLYKNQKSIVYQYKRGAIFSPTNVLSSYVLNIRAFQGQ